MVSKLSYSSFLFILFISVSCAPPKSILNLQDDFNTEQVPSNQSGVWNFFRNFIANLLSSLTNLLNSSNQRETEGDTGTPRPIVSVLNTVVEALRSGSIERLLDSIMDQFNQLVGNIGQMYREGVDREVYVIERNPKIETRERLVLNKLVKNMRLTQSNIEELSKQKNDTELSIVEKKINSIKSNLNEIWNNIKNMYSDYNMKSTNISHVLDRLDFLDPKQLHINIGELQSEMNKLWRDLSSNLMQKIDGIDSGIKRLTKQTIQQANNQLKKDVDFIKRHFNSTHQSSNQNDKSNLEMQTEDASAKLTKFDLLNSSKKLEDLNRLSNLIKGTIDSQSSNLILKSTDNDTSEQDNMPLVRYLRSLDELQIESEKLISNDLKSIISNKFKKLDKLQMTNETNDEDEMSSNDSNNNESNDSTNSNESTSSNDSINSNDSNSTNDSNSEIDSNDTPELDFENESQLKRFTNMLRTQFNQSISQFTNYWRGIGKKMNDKRKNFNNKTASGRKLNFDPFGFRFGKPDLDEDAFDDDEPHLNEYSSSFYPDNC